MRHGCVIGVRETNAAQFGIAGMDGAMCRTE